MTPASVPINPATTRLLVEFKHSSPLIGCRFDPSGRFLFVSAQDNSLQRYDLLSGRKTAFPGHPSWVRGMAFLSPKLQESLALVQYEKARIASVSTLGGRAAILPSQKQPSFTMITGDYHGKLLWWPGASDTPAPERSVEAHAGWIRAVTVSPDGQTLASCGNDQLVKLWSAVDGRHLKTLEGHASHVYNVAFHPDGTHLVSGDLKGIIKDWDLKTGAVARELDAKILNKYDPTFMADIGGIRSIAFSKDGAHLACAGITNVSNAFAGVGNPIVLLFDWKDGKPLPLKPKEEFQGTMWGVDCHPAGYVIGSGGARQGRIWFWKPGEPTSVHTVNVPVNVRDMDLHQDGSCVALACSDGSVKVYTMVPK